MKEIISEVDSDVGGGVDRLPSRKLHNLLDIAFEVAQNMAFRIYVKKDRHSQRLRSRVDRP